MGFQVNGVEYVDNSGYFSNGLKTVNSTALTGTGSVTTGPSGGNSGFGTNWNIVGCVTIAVMYSSFTASGNYGISAGTTRKGIEQGSTTAGSNMYIQAYPSSTSYYYPFYTSVTNSGYYKLSQGTSGSYFSGTWRAISGGFEDPSYSWQAYQVFIRIS